MTDLPLILSALATGIALGGAAVWWLRSRPTTTKAEAMRLLAVEAALIAKMPGSIEAHALAEAQAADEQLASAALTRAMLKAQSASAGA